VIHWPWGEIVLKAYFPIPDVQGDVQQRHDLAFVIAKFYTPKGQESEVQKASRDKRQLLRPKPSNESI
jgi:hypothetical protein